MILVVMHKQILKQASIAS